MKTSDLPLSVRAKLPARKASHLPAMAGVVPFTFTLPIQTVNPLNRRDHWAAKAKRASQERTVTHATLWGKRPPTLPATVTLTRLAPRVMDTDGLAASFKAIRDGVQDAYAVDDGSELFRWRYRQEHAKRYAVRIEIVARKTGGAR